MPCSSMVMHGAARPVLAFDGGLLGFPENAEGRDLDDPSVRIDPFHLFVPYPGQWPWRLTGFARRRSIE